MLETAAYEQIHCMLDCLAVAVNQRGVESRPLYFGVWDGPFEITEQAEIRYYSPRLSFDNGMMEKLYGSRITKVGHYETFNYEVFSSLIGGKGQDTTYIFRMNLFHLPYAKQYRVQHRPHLVVVDHASGEGSYIVDPYFGWEGYIANDVIREALYWEGHILGYELNAQSIKEPSLKTIAAAFEESMLSGTRLADEVMGLVSGETEDTLPDLSARVQQIGVLTKRNYGYGIACSYFEEALGTFHRSFHDHVHELVKGWETVVLLCTKASILRRMDFLAKMADKIRQLQLLELQIKDQLGQIYSSWRDKQGIQ
ncbi:hypothetical protein K0T92_17370 [Paenibacillus oenotherae]|uniref:Butirosin biosynthesis protein H N-terminal domain-containing protein n=1 Tax=Paenibacillus oenotherae TaxID=1435645 RepID=A0ABS7D986_9BACL|nr:DUF6005 family protein [Paenibacillus oenotherae]MBW7476507.1 hypothetical protein [Paenibacillus oenotherae]